MERTIRNGQVSFFLLVYYYLLSRVLNETGSVVESSEDAVTMAAHTGTVSGSSVRAWERTSSTVLYFPSLYYAVTMNY